MTKVTTSWESFICLRFYSPVSPMGSCRVRSVHLTTLLLVRLSHLIVECCGAVIKRRTRDREVPGSIPTNSKCCFLEQETLSTLLSTGFYPGKKRSTWKISTRLLNVLPSINKVDYYYYYLSS